MKDLSSKRLIGVVTGSRGEWGYIRPILRLIEADPDLDYTLIITNMHLLPEFGMSVREIEHGGFKIGAKLHMTFDGYTTTTMAKSLGVFLLELPDVLERLRPDILLLAGDRGEQLMAAIAGAHMNIPVAHIQAGELSGNIDGVTRHAITKFAHLHFAANEEFAERVRRLGEQEFRIFITGAPLVDELVNGFYTPREELIERYRLSAGPDRLILAVQHPVTEEVKDTYSHILETLEALLEIGYLTIMIYPNSDAGSEIIRKTVLQRKSHNVYLFRSLPREDYAGFLRIADVIVGNSSSGIMEAPTFDLPCVNVGTRQCGRPQAANVINVGYQREAIVAAIRRALTSEFQALAANCANPYGDGRASERIVSILKTIPLDETLLRKQMTY